MTLKGILDYTIKNKGKIYFDLDQQLLIYIKGEEGIRKSRVIKVIKMDFIILSRRKDLVISMPIDSAANSIGRSTTDNTLGINNWVGKNYQAKNNAKYLYYSALIIDEMSIIDLKLLKSIEKQLQKAKKISSHWTTVFSKLSLVILMGYFNNLL